MMLMMMIMYNKNLLRCVVNHVGSNVSQRVDDGSRNVAEGKSLNGCLTLGPDMVNNLQGILLRFREDHVAAAGDIRKMFYCIVSTRRINLCSYGCGSSRILLR